MAQSTSQIAKLSRPRFHRAVARDRLFSQLDEARQQEKAAICVIGPPGAGKTTLVASWLDSRAIKGIWYQVDAGDADLATFFYFLGAAAKVFARKGQRPLPLLTPEYLHDVSGFARRFFRDLFSRSPQGSIVVLDNYQEVDAHEEFHRIVVIATQEIPPGHGLIAISRRDPPDCYARLLASERVAFVDWGDLKLTYEETRAIVGARTRLEANAIEALHAHCAGWAAGLTLMLERLRRGRMENLDLIGESREDVFNYFAGVIFDRLSDDERYVLLISALLPQCDGKSACLISENSKADGLLDRLYRLRLFTDRRLTTKLTDGGKNNSEQVVGITYQYHPLFREFLLARGRQIFTPPQLTQIRRRAAQILIAQGAVESAYSLYVDDSAWTDATQLVEEQAGRLLGHGRWRTLQIWLDQIPRELIKESAQLTYWHGMARLHLDPVEARNEFSHALNLYNESNNKIGQLLSMAAIITSHWIEEGVSRHWANWIDPMQTILSQVDRWSSVADELAVRSAFLQATSYMRPNYATIQDIVSRIFDLIKDESLDVNVRVTGSITIIAFYVPAGDSLQADRVINLMEELLDDPRLSTLNLAMAKVFKGYYQVLNRADDQSAAMTLNYADSIAREANLIGVQRFAQEFLCFSHLIFGRNQTEGELTLHKLDQFDIAQSSNMVSTLEACRMWVDDLRGDVNAAYIHAQNSMTAARQHSPAFQIMVGGHLAHAYANAGDIEGARALIQEVSDLAENSCYDNFGALLLLEDAYVAIVDGNLDQGLDKLRRGLVLARENVRHEAVLHWISSPLFKLFECALERNIEVDYVHSLIARWKLPAPLNASAQWPWLVRVQTLGRFELILRGTSLSFGRKVPKKVLALLKVIIVFGGSGVVEDKVTDALWPDEDGDAAHARYKMALARLRALLHDPEILIQKGGKVSLDRSKVWVDCWAFEEAFSRERRPGALVAAEPTQLYGGTFLPDDIDASWTIAYRERLRAKFITAVAAAGKWYEEAGNFACALKAYQRGAEGDSLAEDFCQGQMRCLMKLGHTKEAMSVYHGFKRSISLALGMRPSLETETLYRSLAEI
jgi:ATP/maltotriose-dependent transcriptional regulator MalT/DNA-binding SARP family transcriptional activator